MSTNGAAAATEDTAPAMDPASVEAAGGTIVTLPEPAESDGDAATPQSGERRKSEWVEKKRERGEGMREFRENAAKESQVLREQIQKQSEAIARLEGRLSAAPPQAAAAPAPDPYTPKIAQLRKDADRELALAAEGKTDMSRYYDIQEQISELVADRKIDAYKASIPAPQDSKPAELSILEAEYTWLASNEQARRWAAAAEDQLIAEGRPATMSTTREALAAAAVKFGLPVSGRQATPLAPGRRYGGGPSQATGGEDDGPRRVMLGAKDKELAKAMASMRGWTIEQSEAHLAKLAAEK